MGIPRAAKIGLALAVVSAAGATGWLAYVRRGTRNELDPPLRRVISTVDGVSIGPIIHDVIGRRFEVGIDYTGRSYNQDMIPVLRLSGRFHSAPESKAMGAEPDFAVNVMAYGGAYDMRSIPYTYVSSTGELGVGHEWCYVPDRFKRWMLQMKKKLPKFRNFRDFPSSDPVATGRDLRTTARHRLKAHDPDVSFFQAPVQPTRP